MGKDSDKSNDKGTYHAGNPVECLVDAFTGQKSGSYTKDDDKTSDD